jgi:hypothetical protein
MSRTLFAVCCVPVVALAAGLSMRAEQAGAPLPIQVTRHAADRRVDVTIGGNPFTSHIWPATIKKPVLYPGYPTDWHARGYGLLAANPLARSRSATGRTC